MPVRERVQHVDELSELERRHIAKGLVKQRASERGGLFSDNIISRGVERVRIGTGDGYNQIHGVDFYDVVDLLLAKRRGTVMGLDVGCGLGYFIDDLARHARARRMGGRLEVHGVTLTQEFVTNNLYNSALMPIKAVVPDERLHIGHGLNIGFPDGTFDFVVSTNGPSMYVAGKNTERLRLMTFEEMYRVTRGGGTVYIADNRSVKGDDRMMKRLLALFERAHPEADAVYEESKSYLRVRIRKPARE